MSLATLKRKTAAKYNNSSVSSRSSQSTLRSRAGSAVLRLPLFPRTVMKETCPAGRRRAAGRTVVRRHRVGDLQLQRLVRRQSVLAARGMMSTNTGGRARDTPTPPRNPQTQTTFFRKPKDWKSSNRKPTRASTPPTPSIT
jgi:hypothetical protein